MANEIEMGIAVSANTEGAKKGLTELKSIISETSKESEKQGKASEEASRKEEEGAKRAAEAAKKQADATEKSAEASTKAAEATSKQAEASGKAAQATEAQEGAVTSLNDVLGEASEASRRLAESAQEVETSAGQATQAVQEYAQAVESAGSAAGVSLSVTDDFAGASASAEAATQDVQAFASSLAGAGNAGEMASAGAEAASGAMADAGASADSSSMSFGELVGAASKMFPALSKLSDMLKLSAGQFIGLQAAIVGLTAAFNAVSGFYRDAGELNSVLEQTELRLSKMQGSAELTAASMEEIRKRSRESGTSLKDLAQAAEVVTRAGGDFKELAQYIEETATATGKSLPEVASIITKAMQGSSKAVLQMQNALAISTDDLAMYGAELNENGEISAKTAEQQEKLANAVKAFIENNYFGSLEKYAQTAAGSVDNLGSAIENFKVTWGSEWIKPLEYLRNIAAGIIDVINGLKPYVDWMLKAQKYVAIIRGDAQASYNLWSEQGLPGMIEQGQQELDRAFEEAKQKAEAARKADYEANKPAVLSSAEKKAEAEAKKQAERAEAERQKAIDALEREARRREENDRKAAERAERERKRTQDAEERRAAREAQNRQKQAERDQRNAEKLAKQAEKREKQEIETAQAVASIKAGVSAPAMLSAAGTAPAVRPEAQETGAFTGYRIGINKSTGAWEWQKDQSSKYAGYNLVKTESGAWEWRQDQSAKFEGMVPYQTEAGTWEWRKSTLQQEQAEATAQATEATQNFAESAQSASDNLATVSNDLTEAFRRLAEASGAVFSSFSDVARSAESISNYNISNNVRVDNTLSSGINERQIIQSASAIAQREMSQNLNQSAIIGNSTGFLF